MRIRFLDWYLKIAVGSALIGGSMEIFAYMDNKNGIVDVTCFLLVEDSGDSELDCEPIIQQCHNMDVGIAADEDDAESCSCDTSERLDDCYEVLQLDGDQDFSDWDEPADGWSSCEMWSIDEALGYASAEEGEEEPRFDINLCGEVMDGMEDRLFWETCMAVGYP
ncbi:hypothetical protein QQP08_013901 [Theobroma cacao]|nr:hypothetical protein QQP08_013901 [Theobroma cacao]